MLSEVLSLLVCLAHRPGMLRLCELRLIGFLGSLYPAPTTTGRSLIPEGSRPEVRLLEPDAAVSKKGRPNATLKTC
jgi:hypothetical protein